MTEHFETASVRESVIADYEEELAKLRAELARVQDDISIEHDAIASLVRTIEQHNQTIAQHITRWCERSAPVWEAIASDIRGRLPDIEAIEWPQLAPADEDQDPLYDSKRGYVDQLERYHRHQGRNGGAAD